MKINKPNLNFKRKSLEDKIKYLGLGGELYSLIDNHNKNNQDRAKVKLNNCTSKGMEVIYE